MKDKMSREGIRVRVESLDQVRIEVPLAVRVEIFHVVVALVEDRTSHEVFLGGEDSHEEEVCATFVRVQITTSKNVLRRKCGWIRKDKVKLEFPIFQQKQSHTSQLLSI